MCKENGILLKIVVNIIFSSTTQESITQEILKLTGQAGETQGTD